MSGSTSIVNLGELSKPATVLIEKISDAIGGILRPYQIRRIAEAEAEADKIKAVSQIDITDLQRRALNRFLVEEAKKQNNIETITQKALPGVSDQANPQDVEDDWITNFFDKCRLISDEEMQNVWARVLAGEANAPGKFSKRTVNLLAGLDKTDAKLFGNLCCFGFTIEEEFSPLIYDIDHPIYNDHGLNFKSLAHLESIELIHFNAFEDGYVANDLGQQVVTSYHGDLVSVEFAEPDSNDLDIGQVLLTKTGQELAPICGSKPVEGFVEYVREQWKSLGYKVDDAEPVAPTNPPTEDG